jgi:hypothetical protein
MHIEIRIKEFNVKIDSCIFLIKHNM